MSAPGIYVHGRRHGLRYRLFVTIDGHRLAEVRRTWTHKGALAAMRAWRDELERATDDELLSMAKVSGP